MKIKTLKEVSFDEYINILRGEFPVYGDFLGLFTIQIGDMPRDMATWSFKVGVFYTELREIANNMLDAYVKLVFLKSGYVSLELLELAEDLKKNPEEITRGLIDDLLKGEGVSPTIDEYINLENPKECIRVKLLSFSPVILWNDTIGVDDGWNEEEQNELIEKLTEPIYDDNYNIENLLTRIIVDPLLYRISKDSVRAFKVEIEKKLGNNVVLSPHELLNLLALDRERFEDEWNDLRAKSVENLKKKYEFISLHKELWRFCQAEKDIKEVVAEITKEDLSKADYKNIIQKSGLAVEALLGVLYHRSKDRTPSDRTFRQLLGELRHDIINEFGEDTYNDLDFIAEKRNIVSHPTQIKLTYADTLKVVKKAELFCNLLRDILKLKQS